jgi:hypothetical protein
MTTISLRLQIAVCTLALCGSFLSTDVNAESGAETWSRTTVEPSQEIPHDAKTWSLFLVCNPGWLAKNGDQGITDLFVKFDMLGLTIGPNNLAIWFRKEESKQPTVDDTDIDRSCTYYEKYPLLKSKSPHILVTTTYPNGPLQGRWMAVSLNCLNPDDSADKIGKLADQLGKIGLKEADSGTDTWWWKVLRSTKAYFPKISVSLELAGLKVGAEHIEESKKGCND